MRPMAPALLALLVVTMRSIAQQPAPAAEFDCKWGWFEIHKNVTNRFPTTYQVGGIYRLKKDVVVDSVGSDGHITPYWVSLDDVETVRERLNDPEGTKEREIQALQRIGESNPKLGPLNSETWSIRHRRETHSIMAQGTMLRLRQIWLDRNFEIGETLHPYAEILNGPLQGKWVDIEFLSDERAYNKSHCDPNPKWLEHVGR